MSTEHNFKIGDKVVCVDSEKPGVALTKGAVYEVKAFDTVSVRVGDDIGNFYWLHASRFKHAYPNPPHKHRDLIIAWANGAEIETFIPRHSGITEGHWTGMPRPDWKEKYEYRIKTVKSETPAQKEKKAIELDILELKARLEKLEV